MAFLKTKLSKYYDYFVVLAAAFLAGAFLAGAAVFLAGAAFSGVAGTSGVGATASEVLMLGAATGSAFLPQDTTPMATIKPAIANNDMLFLIFSILLFKSLLFYHINFDLSSSCLLFFSVV
jgi:hypothetical protein